MRTCYIVDKVKDHGSHGGSTTFGFLASSQGKGLLVVIIDDHVPMLVGQFGIPTFQGEALVVTVKGRRFDGQRQNNKGKTKQNQIRSHLLGASAGTTRQKDDNDDGRMMASPNGMVGV